MSTSLAIGVGLRALRSTWSPASIAGLRAWFRADQGALAADGLPADDGERVAAWRDLSGAGADLAQATTTRQPVLVSAAANGMPALLFDGVDDYLSRPAFAAAQPLTICAVALYDGSAGTLRTVVGGGASLLLDVNTGRRWIKLSAPTNLATLFACTDEWHVLRGHFQGATSQGFRDGTAGSVGNTGTDGLSALYAGSFNGSSYGWSGHIAEIAIYDHALTTTEAAAFDRYAGARYGVTIP